MREILVGNFFLAIQLCLFLAFPGGGICEVAPEVVPEVTPRGEAGDAVVEATSENVQNTTQNHTPVFNRAWRRKMWRMQQALVNPSSGSRAMNQPDPSSEESTQKPPKNEKNEPTSIIWPLIGPVPTSAEEDEARKSRRKNPRLRYRNPYIDTEEDDENDGHFRPPSWRKKHFPLLATTSKRPLKVLMKQRKHYYRPPNYDEDEYDGKEDHHIPVKAQPLRPDSYVERFVNQKFSPKIPKWKRVIYVSDGDVVQFKLRGKSRSQGVSQEYRDEDEEVDSGKVETTTIGKKLARTTTINEKLVQEKKETTTAVPMPEPQVERSLSEGPALPFIPLGSTSTSTMTDNDIFLPTE